MEKIFYHENIEIDQFNSAWPLSAALANRKNHYFETISLSYHTIPYHIIPYHIISISIYHAIPPNHLLAHLSKKYILYNPPSRIIEQTLF